MRSFGVVTGRSAAMPGRPSFASDALTSSRVPPRSTTAMRANALRVQSVECAASRRVPSRLYAELPDQCAFISGNGANVEARSRPASDDRVELEEKAVVLAECDATRCRGLHGAVGAGVQRDHRHGTDRRRDASESVALREADEGEPDLALLPCLGREAG